MDSFRRKEMISKERLEELIEQGATIWTINKSGNINPVKTNKTCEIQRQYLMKEGQIYSYIEQTFETEEEAKWFAEFGCIERTERLELPTWEEFKNKKTKHVCFMGKDTFCFFELYEDKQKNRLILIDHDCDYEYFNEELTKENYTTACGLCKEFFLGEKK